MTFTTWFHILWSPSMHACQVQKSWKMFPWHPHSRHSGAKDAEKNEPWPHPQKLTVSWNQQEHNIFQRQGELWERVRSTKGAPNSNSGGQRRLPQRDAATHKILLESCLVFPVEETDGQESVWVLRENIFPDDWRMRWEAAGCGGSWKSKWQPHAERLRPRVSPFFPKKSKEVTDLGVSSYLVTMVTSQGGLCSPKTAIDNM